MPGVFNSHHYHSVPGISSSPLHPHHFQQFAKRSTLLLRPRGGNRMLLFQKKLICPSPSWLSPSSALSRCLSTPQSGGLEHAPLSSEQGRLHSLFCGLCQWHLSQIGMRLWGRGQRDSMDTALKGKKWRSPRARLKIASCWCEYCKQWWRSWHLLPCMSIMTAINPTSLHASQGRPMALAVLMAEEGCQLCSFLQPACRKASLAASLWWHKGEKVGRTCKMWACNGLQPSQNDGKKTSSFWDTSLEVSNVHQPGITFLRSLLVAAAGRHWATWLCSCIWARRAFGLRWCGWSCISSSCQPSPLWSLPKPSWRRKALKRALRKKTRINCPTRLYTTLRP